MRLMGLNMRIFLACAIALTLHLGRTVANAQGPTGETQASGGPAPAGAEVLTRGPIHEAYAEPVSTGDIRPMVVSKRSPDPIEEVPSDMKPADASAIWIGGYWSWDDDRKDFVWVSGVWRVPPPDQRWIAGYWMEVPGGLSWVAGFWSPAGEEDVAYYPPPPATQEQGPTVAAPSPGSVWIPGCWRWLDGRYAWQPGNWTAAEPGWIWVPASYAWSPRGFIFHDGYWDYPLDRRGLLFAPVYFINAAYRQPNFFFSPSVVIQSDLLTFYLFVRPNYSHYYFGDYFTADYDGLGIYPWFAVRRHTGYAYDPLFTYYNWQNSRSDPKWPDHLQGWHTYYRAHPDQRPPHDLAAQRRLTTAAGNRPDRRFLTIADTLQNLRDRPNPIVPLAAVSAGEKSRILQTTRLARQSGTERMKLETAGTIVAGQGKSRANAATALQAPERLRLPKVAGTFSEGAPSVPHVGARPPAGTLDGRREALKPVVPPGQPGPSQGNSGEDRRPAIPQKVPGRRDAIPPEMRKPTLPPGSPEMRVLPQPAPQAAPPVRSEGNVREPQPASGPKVQRPDTERPRPQAPEPSRKEGKDGKHENRDPR
jgi:hypothetical protein